jgi:hypothetical protein
MARFNQLSTRDLIKGIRENDQAQIRANDALKALSKPKTLPNGQAAKEAFIQATVRVLEALQKEASDLSAELARRLPK